MADISSSMPPRGGMPVVGAQATSSGVGLQAQVLAASSLQGERVANIRDETLGEIRDIMIDASAGRVAYAVLSFGGGTEMGDRLFAVPWSALTLDADRECFVLDIDKERLQDAPGFDKEQWPSITDPRWMDEVHSFYQSRPYWE